MGLITPLETATVTRALTTTFVPASNCFGSTVTLSPAGRDSINSNLTDWLTVDWGVNTECYPPNFYGLNSTAYQGGDGTATTLEQYYSPGFCPSGFQNVFQTVIQISTVAFCCPGLSISLGTGSVSWCTLGQLDSAGITVTVAGNGTTTTATAQYLDQRATPIAVAWELTDLSLSPAATPTTSAATPTASAGSQSATVPSTTVAPASSGLSEGAKAGIGVGAAVGGILLAAVMGYWLLRRKRRSKADAKGDAKGDTEDSPVIKAELPGEGVEKSELHGEGINLHLKELGGGEVHEVESSSKPQEIESPTKPVEMDSMNARAELEGDTHRYGTKSEAD